MICTSTCRARLDESDGVKIQANQVHSHLQKNWRPAIWSAATSTCSSRRRWTRFASAARKQGFASRDLHIATTGFDWSSLRDSTANLSLFAERRIVELRLPTGKPGRDGSIAIVDLVAQTGPDLMLIVVAPKLDRNGQSAKWVRAIDAAGVSLMVWPVGPRELPGLDRRAHAPRGSATESRGGRHDR